MLNTGVQNGLFMSSHPEKIISPKTKKQYDKIIRVGTGHYEKGDYTTALKYFTKSLDYKNYDPNILVLMARCLFNLGMKSKAINLMEHALDQSAENPAICESLGSACLSFDLNELAIKFFTIYIQLNPTEPIGYNNLATALRENGQLDESIQLLQEVIPIYPENPYLWNSVAAGVAFRDGYAAAHSFYEESYRLDPTVSIVTSNLCLSYANLQQYDKSLEFAKKTVELAPKSAHGYQALVQCSFSIGNFEEAFKALEWHNHASQPGSVFMPYNIDKWQGEDLNGKTILIGAEQGIGDEILLASLYPAVIQEAKHVIIGCDPRLVPLYQNSFPTSTILPYIAAEHDAGYRVRLYDGLDKHQIDYMCLYMELLRYRWRSLDDIPDMSEGYLKPADEKIDYWKEKLATLPHKLNIGISWRSGLQQAKRDMFYATLLEWAPVLKAKEVNFINVQYGECKQEIKELFDTCGITLHNFEELDLKDDFEGTVALMKNLDLVMGPSTTPVVEAASVGTACWWIHYNSNVWWSFGLDDKSPIFPDYKMSIKPHTLDWAGFMPLFAEEEFMPWLTTKLENMSD